MKISFTIQVLTKNISLLKNIKMISLSVLILIIKTEVFYSIVWRLRFHTIIIIIIIIIMIIIKLLIIIIITIIIIYRIYKAPYIIKSLSAIIYKT